MISIEVTEDPRRVSLVDIDQSQQIHFEFREENKTVAERNATLFN